MTELAESGISPQRRPPLADTSDMAQIHQIFRDAITHAGPYIGSATARGQERVELVATYYDNVLALLHAHHEGEDELIWPVLCERVPDQADEINRVAGQHDTVTAALEAAESRLAQWRDRPDAQSAAAATSAVEDLSTTLIPHLDEEERFIVPLAAQHLTAPEWGELPGHAMRNFRGDKLWLILGLVGEQMRPEQLAMMEAHMPPPLLEMWNQHGAAAFAAFVAELRSAA